MVKTFHKSSFSLSWIRNCLLEWISQNFFYSFDKYSQCDPILSQIHSTYSHNFTQISVQVILILSICLHLGFESDILP